MNVFENVAAVAWLPQSVWPQSPWISWGLVASSVFAITTIAAISSNLYRHQPARRHTLLMSSLIACLACPLIMLTISLSGQTVVEVPVAVASTQRAEPDSALPPTEPAPVLLSEEPTEGVPAESNTNGLPTTAPATAIPSKSDRAVTSQSSIALPSLSPTHWIVLAWLFGSILLFCRTLYGLVAANRIAKRATRIQSDTLHAAAQQAADCVGLAKPPAIATSIAVRSPAVIGYRKMTVVMPPELFAVATDEDLRNTLVHEFAHVRRLDPWIVLLQSLARCLFWPIVTLHFVDRELSRSREEICDNYVLRQASSIDYGETLLKLAELALGARVLRTSVGILHWRGKLEDRIAGFLSGSRSQETTPSRWRGLTMITVGLCVGTLICGTRFVRADRGDSVEATAADKAEIETKTSDEDSGTFALTVRDAKGNPVDGATVELWAIAYSGGGQTVPEAYHKETTTDKRGQTTVRYPLQSSTHTPQKTERLGLNVEHPDHPRFSSYIKVVRKGEVRLATATWATISASLAGGAPITSDLHAAISGIGAKSKMIGPTIRLGPLNLAGQRPNNLVRLVHVPDDGPVFFSKLIDIAQLDRGKGEISHNTTLQPAATVRGKLPEFVPRPVKKGWVAGVIINHDWTWRTAAEIQADGSFTLTGLPADDHLQLIAACDGWVSLPPRPNQVEEYSKLFDYPIAHNGGARTGRVTPQLHYISPGVSETEIAMHPAGSVELTVVDWDNNPVVGATVSFNPNQVFYNGGSTLLGTRVRSIDYLTEKNTTTQGQRREEIAAQYVGTTDQEGVVSIKNLPSHLSWNRSDGVDRAGGQFIAFTVRREGYRLVPKEPQRSMSLSGPPQETVDLIPGETAKIRVRMEKTDKAKTPKKKVRPKPPATKPQPTTNKSASVGETNDETTITVTGSVQNTAGEPVVGAKVFLLSIGRKDKRLAETTTDKEGRYTFKEIALPIVRSSMFIDGGAIQVYAIADDYGLCWHGKRSVLMTPRPDNDPPSETGTSFYEGEAIEMDLTFQPTARLEGVVEDEQGRAVRGAKISLGMLDYIDPEGHVYHKNYREFWGMRFAPERFRTTTTDDLGRFIIADLPAETACRISMSHESFASQATFVAITDRDISEYRYSGTNITSIRDGKVVRYPNFRTQSVVRSPVRFEVKRNQSATIAVVDPKGQAAAGVWVSASNGDRATGTRASAKTGDDGTVKLDLPPGTYRLSVRPKRESTFLTTYDELVIDESSNGKKQVQLRSGCTLILKAIDADTGTPIEGMSFWRDVKDKQGARTGLNSTTLYVDHPVTDKDGVLTAIVEPGKRTIGVGWSKIPEGYQGGDGGRTLECIEGETVTATFEVRKK